MTKKCAGGEEGEFGKGERCFVNEEKKVLRELWKEKRRKMPK